MEDKTTAHTDPDEGSTGDLSEIIQTLESDYAAAIESTDQGSSGRSGGANTQLEPPTLQEISLWGSPCGTPRAPCSTPVTDSDDSWVIAEEDPVSEGELVSSAGIQPNSPPSQPARSATPIPDAGDAWIDDEDLHYGNSNNRDEKDSNNHDKKEAEGDKSIESFFSSFEDIETEEHKAVLDGRSKNQIEISGVAGMALGVLRDYYSIGPEATRQKACYAPLFRGAEESNKNEPTKEFRHFKEKDYLKMFVHGEANPLVPEQREHNGYHVLDDSVLWPCNEEENQDSENEESSIDLPSELMNLQLSDDLISLTGLDLGADIPLESDTDGTEPETYGIGVNVGQVLPSPEKGDQPTSSSVKLYESELVIQDSQTCQIKPKRSDADSEVQSQVHSLHESMDGPMFTFNAKPSAPVKRRIPGQRRSWPTYASSKQRKKLGNFDLRNLLKAKMSEEGPVTAHENVLPSTSRTSSVGSQSNPIVYLFPNPGLRSGRNNSCGQSKINTAQHCASVPSPKQLSLQSDYSSYDDIDQYRKSLRNEGAKSRRRLFSPEKVSRETLERIRAMFDLTDKLDAKNASAGEMTFAPADQTASSGSQCNEPVRPSVDSPGGLNGSAEQSNIRGKTLLTSLPTPKSSSDSDSDSNDEFHLKRRFLRTSFCKLRRSFSMERGFISQDVLLGSVKPLEPESTRTSPKPPIEFKKEFTFDDCTGELDYEPASDDLEPEDKSDDCATVSNSIVPLKDNELRQTEPSNESVLDAYTDKSRIDEIKDSLQSHDSSRTEVECATDVTTYDCELGASREESEPVAGSTLIDVAENSKTSGEILQDKGFNEKSSSSFEKLNRKPVEESEGTASEVDGSSEYDSFEDSQQIAGKSNMDNGNVRSLEVPMEKLSVHSSSDESG